MTRLAAVVTALLLMTLGCATPDLNAQRASKPEIAAAEFELKNFYSLPQPREQETFEEAALRTAELGWKVQTAGAQICKPKDKKLTSGFMYDTRGKNGPIVVSAVFPGSPAQAAGMIIGDQITRVGDTWLFNKGAHKAFQKAMLKEAEMIPVTRNSIFLHVNRNEKMKILEIQPVESCKYTVRLVADSDVNAYADGENVTIFKGIYDLTENDDQLLVVIGHEMAHNSGNHITKKKINRIVPGILGFALDMLHAYANASAGQQYSGSGEFTKAGLAIGGIAWSKSFEREADYAGLYFAHLAGADIKESLRFWKLMHKAKEQKNSAPDIAFRFTGTHPSNAERYANLKASITEILAKEETGQALLPNKKNERKRERKTSN